MRDRLVMPSWEEMAACIFPHLTMEDEVAYIELGQVPYIYWASSPYDQPQFECGHMFWEHTAECGHRAKEESHA